MWLEIVFCCVDFNFMIVSYHDVFVFVVKSLILITITRMIMVISKAQ
jgi:hypothetical protein